MISEDLPSKSNYISIDENSKDSSGLPGVKVNYKLQKNTKQILKDGLKKAKKVLEVAGAKTITSLLLSGTQAGI